MTDPDRFTTSPEVQEPEITRLVALEVTEEEFANTGALGIVARVTFKVKDFESDNSRSETLTVTCVEP
jgi:hypothetical protein